MFELRRRSDPLLVLFLVSGFGGLIYEAIWTHYLKLFLGHAAYAQTVVLVVFIGGLALGAWICARAAERLRNPLRVYALIEVAIGLLSMVFHPLFVAATNWGYASLLPAACDQATSFCVQQWLLAALLLLPQSVLLGMTFPLVSSAMLRMDNTRPGHDVAALYFLNSLGAVFGVLAAAFVLIPALGLPGTMKFVACVNLLLGICAFLLSRDPPTALVIQPVAAPAADAPDAPDAPGAERRLLRILLATAFLTGLSSFMYEIAWIRMLSLVLGASTHSFEIMLASFIMGLALGGAWVRNRVDAVGDTIRYLARVQLAMGAAAALTIPVYVGSFDMMAWLLSSVERNSGGFILFSVASTAIALAVMLPATFCAGMTLPLITSRLLRSPSGERSLGLVYAVNTLGSIIGVIIAVHLLLEWIGLRGTLLVGAAVDVGLGLFLILMLRPRGAPVRFPAEVVGTIAALVAITVAFDIDPRRSASGVFRTGIALLGSSDKVVFHRDGKTATVDVVDHGHVRAIRTNGKSDAAIGMGDAAASDEYTMALLAILPLGHQPQARTAAVIGFGSGMSTATLLASPRLERVDTIEIEPAMVEGARLFRPMVEAAYSDPRSRIVIDDAKSYFARGRQKFDIIVSEPSNPWVSGVASLFTQEFYQRLDAAMNDGAVLAQWIHTYDMDTQTLAAILGAMSKTFPDFIVYAVDADVIVIARKGGVPGTFQDEVMAFHAMQPLLKRLRLANGDDIRRRAVGSWASLSSYFGRLGVPANSDYFPIVDHRASKTRFTRERVTDLSELQNAQVPMMEMLDPGAHVPGRAGPRLSGSDWAQRPFWAVQDIMATHAWADAPAPIKPLEVSARLARLWTQHCKREISYAQALPHLMALAQQVTPHLHPDDARQLWAPVTQSTCARALSDEERAWIDLFAASAARDGAAMARIGTRILDRDRVSRNEGSEYAFIASVTGLLC
ncbi:MAG: fused MFS/spermidine synthase, partial [Pseudomonadota bacterium]|nr:fused MFS/spermidine synthase [Pseudomonadota bacterium]